ncbi:MAG: hypothetical protein GFH27_549307n49 [Chloroflexi bacterium AL-W]|nr:hypothetical protein [Chloroflexi bacterium AL-N1]NOK69081.1 hypothetical protein [Chloroflexi bacterium AL-N10]NOK77064.1 hypothetical protein [Chloroflexi bacterium AL-N5]NOK83709.1 hypothetical protein [Chloroflexi bacterium AL-W]NOK90919.1 hypothetical protein [Chloroflexi bacterium AL-N15]
MHKTHTVRSLMFAIILVLSLGLASITNATGKDRPDANSEGFIASSDSDVTVVATREWTVGGNGQCTTYVSSISNRYDNLTRDNYLNAYTRWSSR